MSGYAKRMMEAAKPWMEANPVPFAERIRVPRKTILPDREEVLRAALLEMDADLRARGEPVVDRLVAKDRRLSAAYDELEAALNSPSTPSPVTVSRLEDEAVLETALASWLLSWGHHGYNVFDLSPSFVASLLLTDPDSLELEELRLPFRGILVLIPDGFAKDSSGGSFTKLHVCEVKGADGDIIDIVASSGRRVLSASALAACVTLHGLSAFGEEDEWGVEDDADRGAIRTLQRIVLGLAAYTASVSGAAVRRPGREPKKQGRAPAQTAPAYWDVGRTVKIDPRLIQAARAGSREIAFRLKHRHIVRGHYRNQPHGQGRQDRKRIWIAPFWKGPEDGAQIVHVYDPVEPTP